VVIFFSMKGFLGTGATFGADLNLVVQLVMGRSHSREAKALQGSRCLPDDGASLELVDDRTGDVAVVPTTGKASAL
jgi:hypothetical protein